MLATKGDVITFLLTDIEGSSRLWDRYPIEMGEALADHDRLLRGAIATHAGRVFATAGDSFAAAFDDTREAVKAAVVAQHDLAGLRVHGEPIRVRMALNAGESEERDGDYFGPVLNRCGRLRDAAHGGQILISKVVRESLGKDVSIGFDLVDLGEHRLRDLEQSERIFQIGAEGFQESFPPLRTLTKATTNFPVQLTNFVGRDHELEEVAKLARGSRLVTLKGVGGSGKTRLAMQAAAAMATEFNDGVWIVDLAPILEPSLVVQAIAAVFAIRDQPNRSLLDGLVEHLRIAKTLLVIDNCEHLVDAVGRLTAALLASTENLHFIATSRESLHVPGEVVFVVPTLGLPPSGETDLAVLGRYDAVRLFVGRSESVRPGFRLTSENANAVVEICHRLDGIPLAIELAAAQLASFSPQQIASHLDQRFRLLSRGQRVGLARQETLQATIDWSYALLNEREKSLLRRLSVFRSDFSLEAAQTIVTGEGLDHMDLLEVLPSLIDKSMVAAEPVGGEMRYRLLETIRQYALERRGESGEGLGLEERHLAWCLELAQEGAADLRSAKHEELLDRLRIEHDNFRQALRWTLESSETQAGLRLAGELYRFWLYNGNYSEGVGWLDDLLTTGQATGDSVRAKALLGYGSLSGFAIDARNATTALVRAVELYRNLPKEPSTRLDYATALNNLAADLVARGDLAEAEGHYKEALRISRELGVQWGVALVLGNLARLAALDGRLDEALCYFDEGVAEARRVGSARLVGDALAGKAAFQRDHGSLEQAVVSYDESIRTYDAAGHVSHAQLTSAAKAIALVRLGDHARAVELFVANAAALLAEGETSAQAAEIVDLALGRAEIDLAVEELEHAASLLGFVEGLVVGGGYDDFRLRYELVRAKAEGLDPARFETAANPERSIDLDKARYLIAEMPEVGSD